VIMEAAVPKRSYFERCPKVLFRDERKCSLWGIR
jgi:hypothetical protein